MTIQSKIRRSLAVLVALGTLSGAGLVDGALTNMATVHPGFSPGVLTVNLPKREESKPRQVKVNVNAAQNKN